MLLRMGAFMGVSAGLCYAETFFSAQILAKYVLFVPLLDAAAFFP